MKPGSFYDGHESCSFVVWAPFADSMAVKIESGNKGVHEMEKTDKGYWKTSIEGISAGTLYTYRMNNVIERPDPASHFQPKGVHGPSAVIDHGSFIWDVPDWKGMRLEDYIIYEMHIGTFTKEGTFESAGKELAYLQDLGITAVELMPVAQFPGNRNWGYDGAYPYAPQNSYGGPIGLKTFVNECHRNGLAVILDVVYNHLGPEGNYLRDFGPYFTDRYKTPWGSALNLDGPYSDEVRNFFIENALYWVSEYHIDALRVDAIHGIFDHSAIHFLRELGEKVHLRSKYLLREIQVIAESDLNDVRVIDPVEAGGYGLDAQWNDDFHHCLHVLLTGENSGYYEDFSTVGQLAKAFREGFIYSGQYSRYRKRMHGSSSALRPSRRFVVFSQNHDQVGNRPKGDRYGLTLSLEKQKLAACSVILSPAVPLIFMGEEYGETAPFLYFVDHSDAALIMAVREGRRAEFDAFCKEGTFPDPQAEITFQLSKIDKKLRLQGTHNTLFRFYRHLVALRKKFVMDGMFRNAIDVDWSENGRYLTLCLHGMKNDAFLFINFNNLPGKVPVTLAEGLWTKQFDSSSVAWEGPGETTPDHLEFIGKEILLPVQPHNVLVLEKSLFSVCYNGDVEGPAS